jgi:hypothetical protein
MNQHNLANHTCEIDGDTACGVKSLSDLGLAKTSVPKFGRQVIHGSRKQRNGAPWVRLIHSGEHLTQVVDLRHPEVLPLIVCVLIAHRAD